MSQNQKNTLFNYFTSPGPRTAVKEKNEVVSTPTGSKTKGLSTPKSNKRKIPTNSPAGAKSSKGGSKSKKVFEVCDIVWAKLHGYPWWPGLVCKHTSAQIHSRGNEVHVQFFDDPPTRAWVKVRNIEKFVNSSDKTAPDKDAESWQKAVIDAGKAINTSLESREKLLFQFSPEDITSDEEDSDVHEGNEDDVDEGMDITPSDSGDNDKENEDIALKMFLELEDSEDDYKPEKEEMEVESESASSGVDSEVEVPSAEDTEPDSPVKKRRGSKNDEKRPAKRRKTNSSLPVEKTVKGKLAPISDDSSSRQSENAEGARSEWAHFKYDFLYTPRLRDADRIPSDDPKYNPRTLYVPEDFKNKLTPAMRQWWDLKSQNFDCVLFFKVGKFYELYHMDAVIGVKELGLTYMKGEFAHSGFPEIAYSRFSSTLVEKGYKVARVEQTETPEMMAERLKGSYRVVTKFDKVVKREICQVTTKGTRTVSVMDGESHDAATHYLLAVTEKELDSNRSSYGVCFVDTTIGLFHIGQFNDDKHRSSLRTVIAHYPPVQVLYNRKSVTDQTRQLINNVLATVLKEPLSKDEFWPADKTLMTLAEGNYFPKQESGGVGWREGLKHFLSETDTLGLSPRDECALAVSALGAVVWYLQQCHIDQQLLAMGQFQKYVPPRSSGPLGVPLGEGEVKETLARHMVLDGITLKNLDILESSGGAEGSLIHRLDFCCTKFGKRLLRQWLCSPLCDISSIESRQQAITDLGNQVALVDTAREKMAQLPDLERLLASIHAQGNAVRSKTHPDSRAIFYEDQVYSKRKIQNFIATLNGFKQCCKIAKSFQEKASEFSSKVLIQTSCSAVHPGGKFPDVKEALDFFYSAFDHETASKEGRIVPGPGVDPEYDAVTKELKQIASELQDYLDEQKKFFGCKVSYFGSEKKRYQLEVPESAARKAGDKYELVSQKKGFKRFATSKTKDLLARQLQAEEQKRVVVQDLSRRIFEQFSSKYELWSSVVQCISVLDVLISLTKYAESVESGLCIPCFTSIDEAAKPFVDIRDGVHPCIASVEGFVSNDTVVGREAKDSPGTSASLVLVTGPNMGGKSTLMRQLGLLTLMAHVGCHIPATECTLTPVDRIFTRLGASDDIMAGESTFFVELSETSAIFHQATKHSLVLVDELGRGTSTHDGTAIAAAAVKELVRLGCRTLFSTHYHSLVEDFKGFTEVSLRHMACMVEEDTDDPTQEAVTFLYKFEPGACPKSYGFNAARLGGIPRFITSRAYEKAKQIEKEAQCRKMFRSLCKKSEDVSEILKKLRVM